MPHLIIGDTFTFIYQPDPESKYMGKVWQNKTELFLGDAISKLEEMYPDIPTDDAAYLEYLQNDIFSTSPKTLWDLKEGSSALCNFNKIVDKHGLIKGAQYLDLSIKDVDDIRLYYRVNSYQYPDSFFDGFDPDILNENAVVFHDLDTITKILIAALYYYTLRNYKLVRCKHCGKWFATKSQKNEYCGRTSPCYNLVVCGKKVLGSKRTCNDAVGIIKQRLADRKKQIYNKWYLEDIDTDRIDELNRKYQFFSSAIKESPTVENITDCMEYLYSDSMPKQERPNRRKSNAEKRRLMGT